MMSSVRKKGIQHRTNTPMRMPTIRAARFSFCSRHSLAVGLECDRGMVDREHHLRLLPGGLFHLREQITAVSGSVRSID